MRYPSFDVTPAGGYPTIGFDGLYTPETFRPKYQSAAAAVDPKGPRANAKYILIYGVPPQNQYAFLLSALKAEQAESILVPEMRPELWGAQVVARELFKRRAPTTLISDNIMGTLFAQGEIRKLCLFYENLSAAGPKRDLRFVLAVQLARLHGVPIELLTARVQSFDSR